MPRTAEELLAALVEATAEGQRVLRDLHAGRRDLVRTMKEQRQAAADALAEAVEAAAKELGTEAAAAMRRRVEEVIAGIEADWRRALGLPAA
jgi:ubiquinone biosynthesis protein UbiJ